MKFLNITVLLLSVLILPLAQADPPEEKRAEVLENGAIPLGNYATGAAGDVVSHVLGQLLIGSGSTPIGNTYWQTYYPAIYVDVDTSAAGFTYTPNYITSLGGYGNHWVTTGGSAIYNATPTGFRVYVRYPVPVTPALANAWGWHVLWVAIGNK